MKKNKVNADDLSALRQRAEERIRKSELKSKGVSLTPDEMHRIIHELSVHQIELEMQQEELLQSREDLEKGLERYTELYDFAPVGYLTLARDSTILEVNLTATKMLGLERSLLKGARLALFIAPEESKVFHALLERVFSHQESGDCEVLLVGEGDPSTSQRIVHINAVVHDDGQSCWTVLSDITRQKLIERENAALQATLLQAQKMESIGRLAGGVAHELNNMLQVMLGNIDFVVATEEFGGKSKLVLAELRNSVNKSAGIIHQLLAFARKQVIKPIVLDLNVTIEHILKILEHMFGEQIRLIFTPGDNLWRVKMDPAQIDQIVTNLALNARDAIKDAGAFFITTHNILVDAAFCECHPELVLGDYVLLEVRDDGCGMDKETLNSIFEPFFTTKSMTEGTGLGLAMVYGIVRQNRGAILPYSTKGKGTTFEIYLPRSIEHNLSSLLSGSAENVPGGNETIMVVDDERALRDLMTFFLKSFGYNVLNAGSAEEALSLSDAFSDTIELLVTDMVMPGMNGRELSEQMTRRRPALKTLLVSGYSPDSFECKGEARSITMLFLGKPFSRVQLALKVRELLESPF